MTLLRDVGRLGLVACLLAASTCGGSSGGGGATPTPTSTAPTASGPMTVTVAGTTQQTSPNGCAGDSHPFTAGAGSIAITLTATSDPNQALSVQVCVSGNDVSTNCAIKQQKIAVGQTLMGDRVGSASQLLKFLPYNCVFGNTFDATPITYSGSLTFQQ